MEHQIARDPKIIVALDMGDSKRLFDFLDGVDPGRCKLKVGSELYVRFGPYLVRHLVDRGYEVFLDLKFHDIPNTVYRACRVAADLGVWGVTVHTLGGAAMLEAAARAVDESSQGLLLIGVTVLTSHDGLSLSQVGLSSTPKVQTETLARVAREYDLDGLVCAAEELTVLTVKYGSRFRYIVPGIRPAWSQSDDQRRVATPSKAIKSGADYLVVGRPITQAEDPNAALSYIEEEINE